MKLILAFTLLIACACAEDPTTPSNVSLIGSWSSASVNLFTLSDIRMELNQQDTGIVKGKWFAKGTGGNGGCPVGTPCDGDGFVVGRSTISRVEIELLGAGKFDGRLVDDQTLRGTFALGDRYDTVTFTRKSLTPQITMVTR
jgi:hypothetical protein